MEIFPIIYSQKKYWSQEAKAVMNTLDYYIKTGHPLFRESFSILAMHLRVLQFEYDAHHITHRQVLRAFDLACKHIYHLPRHQNKEDI